MLFSLKPITLITVLISCYIANLAVADVEVDSKATVPLKVKSWKQMRDAELVKQDLDYSCGSASLATILRSFYKRDITEKDIMDKMEQDGAASFTDLAEVLTSYGFKGVGVALDFQQLKQLKIPAIVFLKYRDNEHFSVIKGIKEDGYVALADPSWGNRQFTKQQFVSMWHTRDNTDLQGKALLVIPQNTDIDANQDFFDSSFKIRTSLAQKLTINNFVH